MNFNKNLLSIFLVILLVSFVFATPSISSISTTHAGGTFGKGEVIPITVTFSEDVNVSGTPALHLNTSASATYLSASTSTTLDFNYTTAANQNTDNLQVSSLTGTIISALDGNAADLSISSNLADGIIIDTNAPTCTITGVTNEKDYNSTTIADANFTFNCTDATGVDSAVAILDDTNTLTTGTSLANVSMNASHTIVLDVNDTLGNSNQYEINFRTDSTAPSLSRRNYTMLWTNDSTPTLAITDYLSISHPQYTLTSSNSQIALKCKDDSNWGSTKWYITNYNTSITTFDITKVAYDCNSYEGYKKVFVKIRDGAGNWSSSTDFNIGYDKTEPSTPERFSISAGNAKMTLNWTAPSSDNLSGNDYYTIYNESIGSTYTTTGISYEVTGLHNGSDYCFTVTTVDKATNESPKTASLCDTPASTTATISLKRNGDSSSIDYAKNQDIIFVHCSYSSSANDAIVKAKTINPNSIETTLKEITSGTTSLDYDYTVNFSAPQERITFWCEASGSKNSSILTVYIDNISPVVSWADTNNTFVAVKRLNVNATDDKYLSTVQLDFNGKTLNLTKDTDTTYYVDLNTIPYENMDYNIKVTATDKAGNKTQITKTITLNNYVSPKQKAQNLLAQALPKQKTAEDMIAYFFREGLIVPKNLQKDKNDADALIKDATGLIESNPELALSKLTQAVVLLDGFNLNSKVDTLTTKNFSFDTNQMSTLLKNAGVNENQIPILGSKINSTSITRKLVILKTGDENKRQATIVIEFINDSNDPSVKIVEIIPKEFVDSAKKVVSSQSFRIIQEDPVIEFTVAAAKGTKASFSYGIGEISADTANTMVDNNILQKFSAPPLVLQRDTKAEDVIQSNLILYLGVIVGGIIIILTILFIIAVLLFFRFANPDHGFGKPKSVIEHLTPEQEAEKKKWEANK